MSQDDATTTEFLRRLEHGETTQKFLEELTKLTPENRADVIQALFRRLKGKQKDDESD